MAAFEVHTIAQLSAARFMDCLVEGTLIAIFAAAVSRVTRRQDSGTRFAVWFAALMAIATLPFVGALSAGGNNTGRALGRSAITLPESWAIYLFAAWGLVAAWALVRVGFGLWHLHVLRRSLTPIDPAELDSQLRETLDRKRGVRPVSLFVSDHVQVPTAIGLVKPAVVIPSWGMQELSSDELNQILLHELAHLRRWDDWTNLAQKIVKALFFFHPAVWWIEKKVSLEREMACDDAVLAETARPRAYAECLAHLAERTLIRRTVVLAQAALGRIRQTSLRVAQILDANRPARSGNAWKPAVTMVAGFAVVCVLTVSRAPRLIAFSDASPVATSPSIAALSPGLDRVSTDATMTGARISKAMFQTIPIPVVHAVAEQTRAKVVRRHIENIGRENVERASAKSNQRTGNMVQLTKAAFSVVSTDAVFVIVEDREIVSSDQLESDQLRSDQYQSGQTPSAQAVYQIRVWRVMVWHPVVEQVSKEIPRKET